MTKFSILLSKKCIFCLFLTLFCSKIFAQGLACQDHINALLSSSCTADLTSAVLNAGGNSIVIKDGNTTIVTNKPNVYGTNPLKGGITIGKIYHYEISNLNNQKCWGTIAFNTSTILPDITVDCIQNYGYSTNQIEIVDAPTAGSGQITKANYLALASSSLQLPNNLYCHINSSSNLKIFYSDVKTYGCSFSTIPNTAIVTRTFLLQNSNNVTEMFSIQQKITIRQNNNQFSVPNDLTVNNSGTTFNPTNFTPSALKSNALQSIRDAAFPVKDDNGDCFIVQTYTDNISNITNGKLITRYWVVINMCTGPIINLLPNQQGSVVQRIYVTNTTNTAPPTISIQGALVITQPCTCIGNKQFADGIVILSAPNEIWTIQNTTLLNMVTGLPFIPGTQFTELPGVVNAQGQVKYSLMGYSKDGIGFNLSAVSASYPNLVLSQSNFCISTH